MRISESYELPMIYIKDKYTNEIRAVGTNHHDRLFLDEEGVIHYVNLQNGCGTGIGEGYEYEFVLDAEGHCPSNPRYSEEEQHIMG